MDDTLSTLAKFLTRMRGCCFLAYTGTPALLQLKIEIELATGLTPAFNSIYLVLKDCHQFSYGSFSQPPGIRIFETNLDVILNKNLVLQGVEIQHPDQIKLFCISKSNTVEAGEIIISARSFQLYDSEYGRLNYKDFFK